MMLGIVALTARKWRIEWMWLVRITAGIVIELTLYMYTRSTRGNYMSLWRDKVTANQWWLRQQSRRSTKSVSTFLLHDFVQIRLSLNADAHKKSYPWIMESTEFLVRQVPFCRYRPNDGTAVICGLSIALLGSLGWKWIVGQILT
jgi:hypothetical protein